MRPRSASLPLPSLPLLALAAASSVRAGSPNTFAVGASTGVSAQQLFLGTANTVYVVDKTENNPATVAGHPAWASEFNLQTSQYRAMDIVTNSFCAGGTVLGNGTWMNSGGNNPVGKYGLQSANSTAPYDDTDGRYATRLLDPCDTGDCDWADNPANYMTSMRWYPTLETLQDGSAIIIGGDTLGGFVNDASQNNPTIEYFPRKELFGAEPTFLPILNRTLPANLFSLTWLVPSGRIFIQTGAETELYDWVNNQEIALPNITHAIRTYPSSAATAMLPLTPANNWTATILMCGGQEAPLTTNDPWYYQATTYWWNQTGTTSCVTINPDDDSPSWADDDALPEGRVMGNLIALPNGQYFLTNGVAQGLAGYNNTNAVPFGTPYGVNPIMSPAIYDPLASAGKRWSTDGLGNLTYGRYYHSSATLLADGSVMIAGSNPFTDFVDNTTAAMDFEGGVTYTQVMSEIFYPSYYFETRPAPTGLPTTLSYGGDYFNVSLAKADAGHLDATKLVLIRPGFSTHAMNMGQRYLELNSTYSKNSDGSATLHVAQLPPNPAVLAPGPVLMFVVVDGVPSNGTMVMAGSGTIGTQPTADWSVLPAGDGTFTDSAGGGSSGSGAGRTVAAGAGAAALALLAGAVALL